MAKVDDGGSALSAKQFKKLDLIRVCTDGGGLYPGIQMDVVPGKATTSLYRAGLIEGFIPHNPAHKERWVITPAGRALLATRKGSAE